MEANSIQATASEVAERAGALAAGEEAVLSDIRALADEVRILALAVAQLANQLESDA